MNVGLFLCRAECVGCTAVDVDAIAAAHGDLAAVEVFDNLFETDAARTILGKVQDAGLDGVVFAACSPHHFTDTLAAYRLPERLAEAGVNPNLIAYANLKEQCALPHRDDIPGANRKAALMVDEALGRVHFSPAVDTVLVAPRRAVLVIGLTLGGVAGAYRASRLGYRVFLLDKAPDVSALRREFAQIQPPVMDLQLNPRVEFLFGADVEDVSGWCGDYTVDISQDGAMRQLAVGGILVAAAHDQEWTAELAPKLHINLNEEGYIDARNSSTMATRTSDDGIFTAGPGVDEDGLRSQVEGASTAITVLDGILSRSEIHHPLLVSAVDAEMCGRCGTCVKTCAFHACTIDIAKGVSVIDQRRCKACGNCVTACPTGARDLVSFPSSYLAESIKLYSGFETDGAPKVLCMLCDGCGYRAADLAGTEGETYPVSVLPLRVACGGRVDTQHILEAFWHGFDGVMVTVCREGHCHNIVGNVDMARRVNLFRAVLTSRELDPERLRIVETAPFEGARFAGEATRFVDDLRAMQ